MSSKTDDQVVDSNHPNHMLDESSNKESTLNPQDCKDTTSDPEGDYDFSEEEINSDDDDDDDDDYADDDYYESLLEEGDNNVDDYSDSESEHDDHYESSPLFEGDYRCFPLSFINKGYLDIGNKIILPANDLAPILEEQIPMPLQFEIRNLSKGKVSNCGVYEFSGDEDGVAFLPDWMMENMQLEEGGFMYLKNTILEKGTYIKIQPHCSDFLEISNPKALLEHNLRKFSCLTKGDTIEVVYGSKKFHINVVETKPDDGISVIDTDIEVDFAPPLDYKEPANPTLPNKQPSAVPTTASRKGQEKEATEKPEFKPFTGIARKWGGEPSELGCLDNKKPSATAAESGLMKGKEKEATEKPEFKPFTGIARKWGGEPSELGCLANKEPSAIDAESGLKKGKEKEATKEKAEFKPFTGIARKWGGEPSELGYLDNKKPSATDAESRLKNGQEKEATTEKPEFKPFTGIARKLGGEPSELDCLANKKLSAAAAESRLKKGQQRNSSSNPSRE